MCVCVHPYASWDGFSPAGTRVLHAGLDLSLSLSLSLSLARSLIYIYMYIYICKYIYYILYFCVCVICACVCVYSVCAMFRARVPRAYGNCSMTMKHLLWECANFSLNSRL